MFRKYAANCISFLRILLTPFLIYFVFVSAGTPFIILACIAMFSDSIDGTVARLLHAESKLGQLIDSVADFIFYPVFTIGSLYLMHIETYVPVLLLCLILLMPLVSTIILPRILAGKIAFLHLRSWQVTSYALVIFCVTALTVRVYLELFYLTLFCMLVACVEETAIYLRDRNHVDGRIHSFFDHPKR